jgi:hypothetical protein
MSRHSNLVLLTGSKFPTWLLNAGGQRPKLDIDFTRNLAWNSAPSSISSLLSCTRATPAAAYYTKADGTLTTFAANTLRYGTNGLLVEEARTNVLRHSNDAGDLSGDWQLYSGTATQNATGPDGVANSAWTISGSTNGFYNQNGANWGGIGIASVWLRAKSGTISGAMNATGSDGTSSKSITITTTWQRFTSLAGVDLSGKTQFCFLQATNPADFEVFGTQAEAGAFATSYIPTTTASVTRAKDLVSAATSGIGWSDAAGSAFVQGSSFGSTSDTQALWSCSSDSSNRHLVYYNGSSIAYVINQSGGLQANIGAGGVPLTITKKVAIAFQSNDVALVVDAGSADTDNSVTLPTCTTLKLGIDQDNNLPLNGYIRRFAYWNSRLSNGALQTLTT